MSMPKAHLNSGQRLLAVLVSLFALAITVSPAFGDPPVDRFPLSTYPMFSRAAPKIARIQHVLAVDTQGKRLIVPPKWVAGREVLQARVTLRNTVRKGRKACAKLCRKVAQAIADEAEFADVESLEVRTDQYRVNRYFSGDEADKKPLRTKVHARCKREGVR